MHLKVENQLRFVCELRTKATLDGVPVASKDVTKDVKELVEEGITNLILGGKILRDVDAVTAQIKALCKDDPVVEKIEIGYSTGNGTSRQVFTSGRWDRWSKEKVLQLREEGTVAEDQRVFEMLLALRCQERVPLELPDFQPPTIVEATLEECGVQNLADGEFAPDRPVLINTRLQEDAITQCEKAGPVETGAAVAGRYVQLPEPLPGTETPIVTIFSGLMYDPRHVGEATRFHYDPAGLAHAQQMCDLRGLGEEIITVFHTHGWGCGDCNQKAGCPLAEGVPSLQDYQLLESLFPGKSTLMPIAGRKLGAEGRRPVLQVYAWRKGQMRPIRFRGYHD